jgi:thiamine biosynthesis lipoprotein
LPIQHVEQCVVVGKCAADADALAATATVMKPAEGMQLIESLLGYEAQLTLSTGETHQSTGWNAWFNCHSKQIFIMLQQMLQHKMAWVIKR